MLASKRRCSHGASPERAGPSTLTSRWPGLASPGGREGSLSVLGAGPAFGEIRVAALHLMRSELHPKGARHTVLMEAPLLNGQGSG